MPANERIVSSQRKLSKLSTARHVDATCRPPDDWLSHEFASCILAVAMDEHDPKALHDTLIRALNYVDEVRVRMRRDMRHVRRFSTEEGIRAAEIERTHMDIASSTLSRMAHHLSVLWDDRELRRSFHRAPISAYVPKARGEAVSSSAAPKVEENAAGRSSPTIKPGSKKYRMWMALRDQLQTGPKSLDELLSAVSRVPGVFEEVKDPRGKLSNVLSQLRGMGLLTAESRGVWTLDKRNGTT